MGGLLGRDYGRLCRFWCLCKLVGQMAEVWGFVVVEVVVVVELGRSWGGLDRVVVGVVDLGFGLGMCFGVA